jgi:hypothetical protein
LRYDAGPSTIGSQAQHVGLRAVMDAPEGGLQIGVAYDYGVIPNAGHWYKIILRDAKLPTPGKFRLTDGEFMLSPGTEGE